MEISWDIVTIKQMNTILKQQNGYIDGDKKCLTLP